MQKKNPPQNPPKEIAVHPQKLPNWVFPLFIAAMTLFISSFFLKAYCVSEPFGHRMISVIENEENFHNVTWDDLILIPRQNLLSLSSDKFFSDPWNSYNPGFKAYTIQSLTSPLFGGALIRLFGNYFIAMSIWGFINFSLMIILIYNIFRTPPFEFSQAASIVGTFLMLNLWWFAGQTFSQLDKDIPRYFLTGYHFSLVELDSGLFTYLPYILFLFAYWKFVEAPSWKRSVFMGGTAGLLSYIYFYHQVFAFALILGHLALSIVFRRKREVYYLAGAFGLGVVLALPFVLNNLMLALDSASVSDLYIQRMDYSPGRSPFKDYHWFLRLQIPLSIGVLYIALREPAELKATMIRTWVILSLAYATVLHLRVVVGFMMSVDHFWRHSLGIPASLWCIIAVFDLVRSRFKRSEKVRKIVYIVALLMPIFILARTAAEVGYSLKDQDVMGQLSETQHEILEKLDCFEKVLKPGEGFLTVDPVLNYHSMVNLKAFPFMALGVSPISVDESSKRYLISAYFTGRHKVQYPILINRKAIGYTYAKDLHLYLYSDLFIHPWADPSHENRIRQIYYNWDPTNLDWKAWAAALSTVKAVYVENEYFDLALERVEKLFIIEKTVSCEKGKALRVKSAAISNE